MESMRSLTACLLGALFRTGENFSVCVCACWGGGPLSGAASAHWAEICHMHSVNWGLHRILSRLLENPTHQIWEKQIFRIRRLKLCSISMTCEAREYLQWTEKTLFNQGTFQSYCFIRSLTWRQWHSRWDRAYAYASDNRVAFDTEFPSFVAAKSQGSASASPPPESSSTQK